MPASVPVFQIEERLASMLETLQAEQPENSERIAGLLAETRSLARSTADLADLSAVAPSGTSPQAFGELLVDVYLDAAEAATDDDRLLALLTLAKRAITRLSELRSLNASGSDLAEKDR